MQRVTSDCGNARESLRNGRKQQTAGEVLLGKESRREILLKRRRM